MIAPSTTRLALLAGVAAVGSLDVLPYARKAETEPVAADHPDVELIALAAHLTIATARRDTINHQLDELYDRHARPAIPEALYWRRSDFMSICTDRNGRLAQYGYGPEARWAYEDKREIDSLKEMLAAWKAANAANGGCGTDHKTIARAEEITAAHEGWVASCKRAEDHDGITALQAASDRADQLVDDLEMRLVRTRARTTEGFAAKARARAQQWCANLHHLEHEIFPALLCGDGDRDELWSVSLLVDAMQLDQPPLAFSMGEKA